MKNLIFVFTLLTSITAAAELTDDNLNAAYKKALSNTSSDPRLTLALKQSQRDWLKFRESQCKLSSGTYHINTDEHAAAFDDCIKTFNRDRAHYLNFEPLIND